MIGKKYKNKFVTIDGIKFHSILEANCYKIFKQIKDTYGINFEMQKKFNLMDSCTSKRKISIVFDFFIKVKDKNHIIEIKSRPTYTATYRLKKNLFLTKYSNYIVKECYSIHELIKYIKSII